MDAMAKASPSEKRQEERLIQELRDFQRSNPANKRCFDCNEMMPHREFAHRVKSISMSKFTESEIKNMVNHGGNEAAQKYWRNKHDPSFRPNGGSDGERTRNFIRLTYIDRKWVYESPRHAKEEEPERTSSKSSKKKEKKADSDDDFFSSSSKPAKKAADSGFADFSNFEGSSRTAAAAAQSFGDFSTFDSPATKASDGFADFGDFSGSTSNTAQKPTPKAAPPPPQVPKFDSFKIAPPPGSHFSSSSVSSPSATNDLIGLSPPKKADDLFGFDAPASGTPSQATPVAASPFDAFDAPTPTSRAGSRANSAASLDPFSDITAASPSAPAPTTVSTSPFDAFGPPKAASPSAFDDFAAPSPASTTGSNVFDAFGGGGDTFGDFTGSNGSSRTNSANPVLDSFASKPEKPVAAPASDPFAAFDGMQSSSAATGGAPTPDFGASGGFPGGNSSSQQQGAMNDPFGFASGANNNSGFPAAQQQHPTNGAANQQFGGFPGGFPQHQQAPNAFGASAANAAISPRAAAKHKHSSSNGTNSSKVFPVNNNQCTQQDSNTQGSFLLVQLETPSVASINDPFASLNLGNLGFGSSNSNTTAARTGSGSAAGSAAFVPPNRGNSFGSGPAAPVASGSFSYPPPPQARATSSFTQPSQTNQAFADPNAYVILPFPAVACVHCLMFGDFASAPAPAQTQASPANPFDLF
ncbi:putative ADP-ribosylation factor GTPase-activating protein AGD14 [Phytophthora citrophthora]|uniref:ADP-ribosylation factor GTPase-activating protein AGD14 n=1 Tax=Phytophthora citrophthora TaxID=4793 RepID=A0AAD9LTS9_9STRA|nr:putative ADP-ribosylation factor GTPase-activating protein AGD14 [Phytophthora citrophthora]